jgi:hypothetical protein
VHVEFSTSKYDILLINWSLTPAEKTEESRGQFSVAVTSRSYQSQLSVAVISRSFQYPASSIEHQASSIKHQASSIQHRESSIENQVSIIPEKSGLPAVASIQPFNPVSVRP